MTGGVSQVDEKQYHRLRLAHFAVRVSRAAANRFSSPAIARAPTDTQVSYWGVCGGPGKHGGAGPLGQRRGWERIARLGARPRGAGAPEGAASPEQDPRRLTRCEFTCDPWAELAAQKGLDTFYSASSRWVFWVFWHFRRLAFCFDVLEAVSYYITLQKKMGSAT